MAAATTVAAQEATESGRLPKLDFERQIYWESRQREAVPWRRICCHRACQTCSWGLPLLGLGVTGCLSAASQRSPAPLRTACLHHDGHPQVLPRVHSMAPCAR